MIRRTLRVSAVPLAMLLASTPALGNCPSTNTMLVAGAESVAVGATAIALILVALLLLSAYTSISAVVKAELFPAHIRALGVSLPYALANAVFGGTGEYFALWLKQSHVESYFYVYVALMSAIALAVALMMRDTKTHSLILED
mgnify:CR=1 FL=1